MTTQIPWPWTFSTTLAEFTDISRFPEKWLPRNSPAQRGVHLLDVHLARMYLHDASARLLVRRRKLDLAVQTTGPQKCRVQDVHSVRCGNYLHQSQHGCYLLVKIERAWGGGGRNRGWDNDNWSWYKRCNNTVSYEFIWICMIYLTIFSWMLTIVCCLLVELGLGLDLVSGWLVVMHTYLHYIWSSLSHSREFAMNSWRKQE